MKNPELLLQSFQKKQNLIQKYFLQMSELESERKLVNKKIKAVKDRLRELVMSDEDPAQLKLFEDIDQYLANLDVSKDDE